MKEFILAQFIYHSRLYENTRAKSWLKVGLSSSKKIVLFASIKAL